jgi:hypothetical protein
MGAQRRSIWPRPDLPKPASFDDEWACLRTPAINLGCALGLWIAIAIAFRLLGIESMLVLAAAGAGLFVTWAAGRR